MLSLTDVSLQILEIGIFSQLVIAVFSWQVYRLAGMGAIGFAPGATTLPSHTLTNDYSTHASCLLVRPS